MAPPAAAVIDEQQHLGIGSRLLQGVADRAGLARIHAGIEGLISVSSARRFRCNLQPALATGLVQSIAAGEDG